MGELMDGWINENENDNGERSVKRMVKIMMTMMVVIMGYESEDGKILQKMKQNRCV